MEEDLEAKALMTTLQTEKKFWVVFSVKNPTPVMYL